MLNEIGVGVKEINLIIKTAKLVPYLKRSKAVPSYATAYDFEPEPGPAQDLGNLLVVIEVLAVPKQAEAVADLVIQTLGNHFYNFEATPSSNTVAPTTYDRFEAAVKAVNHALREYADHGHASWVGRLSAILAVQIQNQLHITQAGSASGYLYRHGKVTNLTAGMSGAGPHRPGSSFSSIASGSLDVEDRILLGTPALYHQIDRNRLTEIISDNTPETSLNKLSELIGQHNHADRVSALIIEVTTPELLSMQRGASDGDSPIMVGQPESLLASAKEAATPVVTESLVVAKKASLAVLRHGRTKVIPQARQLAVSSVDHLSRVAKHPKQRRWLYAAGLIILTSLAWTAFTSSNSQAIDKLAKRYNQDYSNVNDARAQIATGDKPGARQKLLAAATDLDQLAKLPQAPLIERRLSRHAHPESDPISINTLRSQIDGLINEIDGLLTVSPQDVTTIEASAGLKPSRLESVGGKIVLIDPEGGSLAIFDPNNNQMGSAVTSPTLGKIIASTVSSNDDGVYLLTNAPAVWFFKLDGTLIRQNTSFGEWPKGRAIASYSGNLYILAEDSTQIYKHTRSLGGFSGRAAYLSPDVAATIAGSTAILVDGSVYTAGPYGLKRFIATKPDHEVVFPDTLAHPSSIASSFTSDTILVSDATSSRLGVVSAGSSLSFNKQITLTGKAKLLDAKVDPKSKTIFALTSGKLVKFSLPR